MWHKVTTTKEKIKGRENNSSVLTEKNVIFLSNKESKVTIIKVVERKLGMTVQRTQVRKVS